MDTQRLLHDTTIPYEFVEYNGIEYTTCKDFDHISRYKRLRQVIHYLSDNNRFLTLETQNVYDYPNLTVEYYSVPLIYENRLDLISYNYYNTPNYSWILSYINEIEDGFTVHEGQVLMIPVNISDLFASNSILSAVSVSALNLGTE